MFESKVFIEDDRGNKVTLFNEGVLAKLSGEKAGRVAAAAYDTTRSRKLGAGEIVVYAVFSAVSIAALGMNDMGVWATRPKFEVMMWVLFLCSPLLLAGRHFMRKSQAARLRAAFLGARLCPSCGYDIPKEPGPDAPPGFVQCPECGAWWRLPEPG